MRSALWRSVVGALWFAGAACSSGEEESGRGDAGSSSSASGAAGSRGSSAPSGGGLSVAGGGAVGNSGAPSLANAGSTSAAGAAFGGSTSAAGAAFGGSTSAAGAAFAGSTSAAGAAFGGSTSAGAGPKGGQTSSVDGGAAGSSAGGTDGKAGSGVGGSSGSSAASSGPPEASPRGYAQGTTGGGAKAARRAASLAEMQALVDEYPGSGGLVIEYTGQFDFETITDPCVQHTRPGQTLEIKRKSDITIVGADGSAANFGIRIASTSSNVIVRNMTIGLTPGGDASDIISIEGMSDGFPTKIWIDHNEFFTSMVECDGAGDTEFDGMIDLKKGADDVTVSYNHFHDHHKVSLNGSSDSDTASRRITFHHNLIEKVGSRVPLQRGGLSHIVNNYFSDVRVSGINVRMGGNALVEANYFEKVKNPVTSRDSDEVGFWDLRNNNLGSASDVGAGNSFEITWDDGNDGTVNAIDWKTTRAFPSELGYTFVAHPFGCVRAGLRAVVGAGKGLRTLTCD